MSLLIENHPDGAVLAVKVVPNSSRDQLVGPLGQALKIKVAKPPESGQANKAVCQLLAEALEIAPSRVTVLSGHSQAQKRLVIQGLPPDHVAKLLKSL